MVTGTLLYKEELGIKIKAGRPYFLHLHYNAVNKQHSAITIRNTFPFIILSRRYYCYCQSDL